MKTVLIYTLIFSILMYSATAANVYEAADFIEHPEQLVILEEKDAVRLNWDDKEHKLVVREIYLEKGKVDLTAFITGAEVPYYVTITPKTSLQLDFDQDLEYDMKVSIFNILEEEKVVVLKLEKLEKESSIITTSGVIEKESENRFYQNIIQNKIYLFIGLVFLGLGIWKRRFFLKTCRKMKKHN